MKHKLSCLIALMLCVTLACSLPFAVIANATVRHFPNGGTAWEIGGWDNDGVFLCDTHNTTRIDGYITLYWDNPLVMLFPGLVVDC